jgi:signal transduction histidine kinase/DNA-binding response OmpR family regulator
MPADLPPTPVGTKLEEPQGVRLNLSAGNGFAEPPDFLAGGGEMGRLMRAEHWGDTPLGPPDAWPQSLKTVIRILLSSRYAMWMGWGDDLTFFYNDAYRPTLGVKHAWALGASARKVWQEIWPDIGPRIEHVLKSGEATWDEGLLLFLERSGYPEETYHTFSYSPLADDSGKVVGMLCVVMEETERIIGDRRLSSLREIASDIAGKSTRAEVLGAAARQVGANLKDLPFTLTYLFQPDGTASLAYATGVAPGHKIAPTILDPADAHAIWPAGEILARRAVVNVGDLGQRFDRIPTGAWDKPPREVVMAPIARQGQDAPAGFLVAAVNPYRSLDEAYLGFINLVAGQIASGLANAEAYEQERHRAEALAEIDRAKTTFFSNVSHEFRTPLTLMLGPLEDVLVRPGTDTLTDHRPLLHLAHRNGVRLLKLVNTLLDFSRIEAGRVQANFEPTDLAAYTADLVSTFHSALEKAGLRLVVTASRLPQQVHVDRDMWEKVVLNLVSNAFKFTLEGEIGVDISPSADGACAEVTVRDTGTGIPPDELPHLFERFRRVEGARGRSIEGSGIGLALVQELVKLHGGTIRVVSAVSDGSAFTVAIPFGTAHLPADGIGRARAMATTNVRAQAYVDEALGWLSGGGEDLPPASALEDFGDIAAAADGQLVLLADDNADMRNYVQRLLRTAGFQVETATDGQQALAAARRLRPDLVLSDVMMPELDGFGLLKALRADPDLRETPVILLSARAGEEAKVEGFSAGADDYLTKPFSARELLSRVGVNLQLSRTRGETARVLKEEAQTLELLNKVGTAIAAELDLERTVQIVTDAATELSGAAFGSFFYNVVDERGESYTLYAISGVPKEAFAKFPMPRNTAVFGPTFSGEGIVRSPDITRDPRYGLNAPHHGPPAGHLPVRSYLAAPVVSQSGEVLGGLFFGHPELDIFTERAERLVAGIATQAAIAIDKARLYQAAQTEIEQRKRVEAALRESEQLLEAKVDQRTAELASANERLLAEAAEREHVESVLRQAQKMEGIGLLTGGIAHDFNNLLTIIVGNLEILQRQLVAPAQNLPNLERSVASAMRGAQRAVSLTQRLLAFSRQQPLDPKPIDIGRLVTGMSDLLRRTLGEQTAVETVLAGGLWRVNVDANQLEIAIVNLAVNARDAMPNGGKLTIETSNASLDEGYATAQAEVIPGQYVMLAVTDNGTGMSRETLAKAFEPFFTTKDIGHGTGLGLSQVYGFVKQSGGHVKIYSEPGEGTTVRIYLPRLLAGDATIDLEPVVKIAHGQSHETILVVEDDSEVRAYTTGILRELGYAVLEAPNGRIALELLQQHPEIALLFTDVGLPGGMNGRVLADTARQQRRDLKVLFTTGYARNAIVHDGRLDPGVQLITKPFTYAAVAGKIRDVLDARSAPMRILLVEDEVLIQILTGEFLEDMGIEVETAGSAAEARNILRAMNGKIDAAIIDVGLPDTRGDVLVSELRSIYPALPIVIASGHDEAGLRERFKGTRLLGFLSKPYSAAHLREELHALRLVD